MATDNEFGCDDGKRRCAISAYYALCTMMDEHVGAICEAVDSAELADTTTVIYTSDHGEALGLRGHWAKSNLYDECTQVPLVVARLRVNHLTRSEWRSPSITRWERPLGHSCYAKDAGSYTSMWVSMPSCSISNPIPKK